MHTSIGGTSCHAGTVSGRLYAHSRARCFRSAVKKRWTRASVQVLHVAERGRIHETVDFIVQHIAQVPPGRQLPVRHLYEKGDATAGRSQGVLVRLRPVGAIRL